MENSALRDRYSFALSVAKDVGRFLSSHENLRHDISEKAENDFVTIADKKAEDMIENGIRSQFPDDSIFGEENGLLSGDDNRRWIVDPIDGTVDFMTGFPNYTVSIAFQDESGIAFGVVYVVKQDEMFSAFRGEGALLNGLPIHTDETSALSKQLAILVPPHRHHEYLDIYMTRMRRFYDIVSDVRSLGSAACSLCYVATGRVAIYYEMGLKLYDCAAGVIIVKEAGGKVSFIRDEEDWIDIAASSSSAYENMMEIVS